MVLDGLGSRNVSKHGHMDPKSAMKRTVMASKEREERREELLTAFRETIDNQDLLGIREAGFPSHFDGL